MPLKYLSNFWRTLNIPLIYWEVPFDLTWSKDCVLTSKSYRVAIAAEGDNPAVERINNPTTATFKIKDCRLYVLVVFYQLKITINYRTIKNRI